MKKKCSNNRSLFFNNIGKDILYGGILLAQEGRISSQGLDTIDSVFFTWLLIAPDDNVILLQFKKIALVDKNQCDTEPSLEVNNSIYFMFQSLFHCRSSFNPLVTNELSHPYHLDRSIFNEGHRGYLFIFISLFDKNRVRKENSPRLDATFCGDTFGAILFAYVP